MCKWRRSIAQALKERGSTCCQCDPSLSPSCVDDIAEYPFLFLEPNPISVRDLIPGCSPRKNETAGCFLICRIGYDPMLCCATVYDESGSILAALASPNLLLWDCWLLIPSWNFLMIDNKYYLEVDCSRARPLSCHFIPQKAFEHFPEPLFLSECELALSIRRAISISFAVAAISPVFQSESMFFVKVICVKNHKFARLLVFTIDLLSYHPLLRIGYGYKATNVRAKMMKDARGTVRSVLLLSSESCLQLLPEYSLTLSQIYSEGVIPLDFSSVINYDGVITGQLMDGVFQLDNQISVYFTHAVLAYIRLGIGLRIGARIRLYNVHIIYSGPNMIDLALCTYSSLELLQLAPNTTPSKLWQRPAISIWSNRLNLPHTVQICRALLTLKRKFRGRISSQFLLERRDESCRCLEILYSPDNIADFRFERQLYDEFFCHDCCTAVPHPSLILCRPPRSLRMIDDLLNHYHNDMSLIGPDRIFVNEGREILAGLLLVDPLTGSLFISDRKGTRIRCYVRDLRLDSLNQPLITTSFSIVSESIGTVYIILSLKSSTFLSQGRALKVSCDRCSITGRILQVFPSILRPSSAPSFSVLCEAANCVSTLLTFKGRACALESSARVGSTFKFLNVIATTKAESPNMSAFILDDDSDMIAVDDEISVVQTVDDILTYDCTLSPRSVISVTGLVISKEIRSVGIKIDKQLKLLIRSQTSPQTIDVYVPIDKRKLILGLLVGTSVYLHRISRCVTMSGNLSLFGSAETFIFIPEQRPSAVLMDYSGIPVCSLASVRTSCTESVSTETRRFHVRLVSVLSLTFSWSCPICNSCPVSLFGRCLFTDNSTTARISCKITAVVDDGTGQAILTCTDHDHAWALLPKFVQNETDKMKLFANPEGVFSYDPYAGKDPQKLIKSGYVQPFSSITTATNFVLYAKARMSGKFDNDGGFHIEATPTEKTVTFGKSSLLTSSLPQLFLAPVSIQRMSSKAEAYRLLSEL